MKKIMLVLVFMAGMFCTANAQVDGNAIGIRFGYGGEVSYQHALGSANRLELDLGLHHWGGNVWGTNITGVYQWVWDLSALADGFNWYAGAGATLGLVSSNFALGAVGQVGIEYNFNIPLQFSIDYRPAIYVIPTISGGYGDFCFSARYKF